MRFLPPLIMSRKQAQRLLKILAEAVAVASIKPAAN
jgi:4-aminobutyrate aminotransferase-like enzyme